MLKPKDDLPFTLRGYHRVADRRRAQLHVVDADVSDKPQPRSGRDDVAESFAAAEEIAGILAAQAGDDIAFYRHQAAQIFLFMNNAGWTISRRKGG